ncbi:MAG TPA: carotenoid oxygenase family protein [Pyrinomonadaceae bacterium]|nr:carotenoid oxygenase family protein [Pyrinomonadaceae bacterium]
MQTNEASTATNPFLQGNFAPVREEVTVGDLMVTGKLPPEMDGMFVRNGPNPQFPPIKHHHWFEGDGMLHGVRIRNGRASYRNRYIRTPYWKAENAAGRSLYGSFLDPPTVPLLLRLIRNRLNRLPMLKNTANTALICHDNRLLALWEGGEPHQIQVPDLETVCPYTYDGNLKHQFTAHPKVDPATGEMLFFGYSLFKSSVQYSVVSAQGEIARTVAIGLPRQVMMHDFAITPRYTLFMDLPITFSLKRMLRGQPLMKFEPELGARFGVLPRHGTGQDIKWFEVSPCFVFHTLNAYEDGDEVVLLACRTKEFPDSFFMIPRTQAGDGEMFGEGFAPVMYRWRLNLKAGTTREEALDDVSTDFPRINEGLVGSRTRYGFTVNINEPNELFKYDFEQGRSERHDHGKMRIGGEGVFVPRPGATAEDDGWLVTYVHDEENGTSELIVIEAGDFSAPPVARVRIPARVPYGFHGAWVPGQMLANG